MTDGLTPRPPRQERGRPFERAGRAAPADRRIGCRNKGAADIAAAMKVVTSPLAGDDRGGVGDA
jgi:hypothetical protein